MSSYLAREIASQPSEVASFLDRHASSMQQLVRGLPKSSYVVVAARGSSDHAATYARYVLGGVARLPVAPAAPSLHTLYRTPPRFDHGLVVGISQSGQSPDVVSVVEEARKQGRPTIAFTNDLSSPLGKTADQSFNLCLTPEHAIAATKTYTTQLAAVALLGAALADDPARFDELRRLPESMEKVLAAAAEPTAAAAAQLKDETSFLTIARGINLCTAEELALKLRELLRVTTQGFSAADFRHGSIALIVPGTPALLIAPAGIAAEDMNALAGEVTARGAKLAVIAENPQAVTGTKLGIPLGASVPEWLSPLTAVLPGQLLALNLVLAKGLDPDRPRGLPEKVVKTV